MLFEGRGGKLQQKEKNINQHKLQFTKKYGNNQKLKY